MTLKCVIPGCNSTEHTKRLFSFPIDNENLSENWFHDILNINQPEKFCSSICEDHFSSKEITTGLDLSSQLVPGAVPSNFQCIRNVPKNSCRFCLKILLNPANKLPIDDSTKKYFKDLTSLELQDIDNFSNFSCSNCCQEIKRAAQVKNRISKIQNTLVATPTIKQEQELEERPNFIFLSPCATLKCEDDIKSENSLVLPNKVEESKRLTRNRKKPGDKRGRPRKYLHVNDGSKTKVQCNYPGCIKVLSAAGMFEHMRRKHQKIVSFICDFDGRSFYKKSEFVTHMTNSHVNGRTVKCYICNLEFSGRERARDHLKKEHLDSDCEPDCDPNFNNSTKYNFKFKCKDCGVKFSSILTLRKHRIKRHSNDIREIVELERREQPRKSYLSEKICCQICGKIIVRRSLKSHKERFHSTNKVKLVCDLCGKEQLNKKEMFDHMRVNHMARVRQNCPHCEFSCYKGSSFLKEHIDIVHFNRGLVCELCGQSISNKYKLKAHIRVWHTNEKPYKCEYCDKSFATASRRSGHVRSLHKEEPSECNLCGKIFSSKENCRRHLRMFHGEKKVACSFEGCQERFMNQSLMLVHLSSHTGLKKWLCKYCPHSNVTRCGLRRHLRDVHMSLNITCEVLGCNFTTGRKELYRKHVKSKHRDIGEVEYQELLQKIRNIPLPKTELD